MSEDTEPYLTRQDLGVINAEDRKENRCSKFNGSFYVYNATDDTLTRDDVHKANYKAEKQRLKEALDAGDDWWRFSE